MRSARVAGFGFGRGKSATRPVARATQSSRSGQAWQSGLRGFQISAPISIKP